MGIQPGKILAARYRADMLLGQGGMGEVWRCFDLEEKRNVAVKTLLSRHLAEPWLKRLFHAEVVAVAQLSHPGIVEIYDLLEEPDGTSLLVMGFRKGRALDGARPLTPSWSFVRSILTQMLEALAHAHARGVLHLDIKPPNVLVGRDEEEQLKITIVDFGVARVKQRGRAAERWVDRDAVFGTPEFMAPEQFMGQLSRFGPWTDLYAVGMLAYDLCAGDLPLADLDPLEAVARRAHEAVPALVPRWMTVPEGFCELVGRMLAPSPAARPSCAADVLSELDAIDGGVRVETMDSVRPAAPGQVVLPSTPTMVLVRKKHAYQAAMETVEAQPPTVLSAPGPDLLREAKPLSPSREIPLAPASQRRAGEAEKAFTSDTTLPTPGAYGLFGLRALPVLGRVEERRRLWTAVGATSLEQRTRAVVFSGPVGTGKSRLARDASERALEFGLAGVLTTHWSASGAPDEGLRGLVENALETRGSTGDDFRARLEFWLERHRTVDEAYAREARVLLRPELDAAPDAGLPVRVALETVSIAARDRPLVLWLDDVQWSRGEATNLVEAIAGLDPALTICVLATARDDELGDGADFAKFVAALEKLAGKESVEHIPMQPLDDDATRTLVRGLLDLEDDLAEVVVRRSEGNPLFVTQLVGQLVGERAIEPKGKRYVLSRALDIEAAMPGDIDAIWARRVAVSGAASRDLQTLALVRERVGAQVVAELIRLAGDSFANSVDRALAAGLVRKEGELYTFSHGLLRQHLKRSIARDDYAALAGLAADALAPLVGQEDVQAERAQLLRGAGRRDEARSAMLDASLWSWRRLDHEARAERLTTLLGWSTADGATEMQARALAERASLFAERGNRAEATDVASRATTLLGPNAERPTSDVAWIWLRQAQVSRLQGGQGAKVEVATARARDLAKAANELEVMAIALGQLGLDAQRRGDKAAARRLYDDALAAAHGSKNRGVEAQCAAMRATMLDEAAACEASLASAIDMARAAGALRIEIMARSMWCEALWKTGAHAKARQEVQGVLVEADRRKVRQIASLAALQAACWAVEEDDWAAARSNRDKAAAHGAADGAMPERAHLAGIDLALAIADRDAAKIAESTERLLAHGKGYGERSFVDLMKKVAEMAPEDLRERIACLAPAPAA